MQRVRVGSHSRTSLFLHVVFATRYRACVLAAKGDVEVANVIEHFARDLDAVVLATGCASDHVHVLAQLPPSLAPAHFVGCIKAGSSRVLRRRLANGWQTGYWAESIGSDDIEAVRRYVLDQRAHHASTSESEAWEYEESPP